MRKKIDSCLIISNGEEEKDKGVSCVARVGIDNYSINEKKECISDGCCEVYRGAKKNV